MQTIILGIFSDFNFILKIFFFLFIISFVRQRITHNTFALILISIATIFLIFISWPLIGPLYFIYVLITIGISTVLVDFFFVSMDKGPEDFAGGSEGSAPLSKGKKAMKTRDNVKTAMDMKQNQRIMQNLRRKRKKPKPPGM